MAKKWPEKVVQRSFIKEHSFPNGLYMHDNHNSNYVIQLKKYFVKIKLHKIKNALPKKGPPSCVSKRAGVRYKVS